MASRRGRVLLFAVMAHGHEVTTVEGLGTIGNLHPIQEAFMEAHGLQCGYCTPGFLMTLVPFLKETPDPSEEEIREAISGNLCRCTGYKHIMDAVKLAADQDERLDCASKSTSHAAALTGGPDVSRNRSGSVTGKFIGKRIKRNEDPRLADRAGSFCRRR